MFFSEVIAHKTIVRNKALFPECLIFDCSNTLKAGFSYCSALQQMFLFALHLLNKLLETSPGKTHFSKVSKLFGCNSGNVIDFFVSSKHRRLQASNLTVILIFILFTTYQKTSFTGKRVGSFEPETFSGLSTNGPQVPKNIAHHVTVNVEQHSMCCPFCSLSMQLDSQSRKCHSAILSQKLKNYVAYPFTTQQVKYLFYPSSSIVRP